MKSTCHFFALVLIALPTLTEMSQAAVLQVGPGHRFARIEDAYQKAKPGDTIAVRPLPKGQHYLKVALFVTKPRIAFRAINRRGEGRVKLDGKGFDYSGRGQTPRAIFQFNKGADGCLLEGFELTGASGEGRNGSGVRINQANHITIRNCEIHHNEMGVMSNGKVSEKTGSNILIEYCHVHHNGTKKHPGYNHNFYMGGTSVIIRGCDVHHPLTGHNIKSRAHYNRIEYSYIHDSLNREFDLVDHKENTTAKGSHTVLLGNIIVKDPKGAGNKNVIHFGQDGGSAHQGTLYLIHNTLITPFISPVVDLSAKGAGCAFFNNIIWNPGKQRSGMQLLRVRKGASMARVEGSNNWIGPGFNAWSKLPGNKLKKTYWAKQGEAPPLKTPQKSDYALKNIPSMLKDGGLPLTDLKLPKTPGDGSASPLKLFIYRHPLKVVARKLSGRPDLGAYEAGQ